jgi:hypothetical protein
LAWCGRGRLLYHSFLVERLSVKITGRWEMRASHKRKMKNRRATNETTEPIEERAFQHIYASG